MRISRNYLGALLTARRNSATRSRSGKTKSTGLSILASQSSGRTNKTNATNKTDTTQMSVYQKMKEYAGEVQGIASKLTDTGEDSLFAKAKESEDTSAVTKQVKEFVDNYNSMVKNLRSGNSRVDSSYLNQLNSYARMYSSSLKAAGVSQNTDGTLSVDNKALTGASLEQLQEAFGAGSSFAAKAGTVAANVKENAVSSLNSLMSNSYSNLLKNFGTSGNYYNFWS